MAQTNLLELAKQGDPQAIATLMNRSLQPRGMTASVDRQGACLYVTLQAEQVPNRQVLTAFVQNGISNLGVSSIQLVKIAGQQFGMAEPAWTQDLQVETPDLGDLGLGDLGLENPEPSDLTVSSYEADISLDGLDDIAPAPDPVGDILSELTGSPRSVPPSIPTFEPEGLSPEDSALDFENEFASSDFSEDFSQEAIATDGTESSDLSDDLLADLDLGADLGSTDLGLEAFDDPNTNFGESIDDDLGLGDLDDLESSLSASDADGLSSAFGNTTPSDADMGDSGVREPSSDALLSDLDTLESTQNLSFDEPDELLNDLGSLEDDLAQMGDEFLGIDAVTGEARAGMGLEPDEFDFSADSPSEFSSDFSTEPLGEVDEFGTDLAELDLLNLSDSASATDTGNPELTPDTDDFPLTDFAELSPLSGASESSSGLEGLDFDDSTPANAEFGDVGLGDLGFDADDQQDAIAPEAIAAGFESEAQFDDPLSDSSTAEFDQPIDFTEIAPTPAPYVAQEVSLDLDLDDIHLPPVTTEGGDDWDAELEFGNLAVEDLSGFTANPAEPAETAAEAAAELEALDQGSALTDGEFPSSEFPSSEFPSGDWEAAALTGEPSEFDVTPELGSSLAPLPTDFAESAAATPISAPAEDAAPWLSELPSEFAIDVTLDGSLLESAEVERLGSEESRAIAPESTKLAQDLDLEAQNLHFDSVADSIAPASSPAAASGDFDFDLDNLDGLDYSSNSDSPDGLPDADLFDETPDIPLSQLPTEIPSSEIREDDLGLPDFLDTPLSEIDFDEAALSSEFDSSSTSDFTLEDETAPTEIMTPSGEALPSELLVDDLDDPDGFELDNLEPGPDSREHEDVQPSAPEASSSEDFGLGRLEEFDLGAPAADWQSELEPLPETTFGLEDEDETEILRDPVDPSTYPESSFDSAAQSPDLNREELDWLANEATMSANPPAAPLSSAEEGWSYGIPPAPPPPPEDTFAYSASAPQTPDPATVEAGEQDAEAEAESGGRVTNLLYGVLLALLAWILALIGRSLWTELTQPALPPAPPVEVSPQSQEPEQRSPFSSFS